MIQNSELIEWLKKKAETVTMPGSRKMYQAAVKALEAQKDMVSRKTANVAICNACGKIDCDQVDKCEKLQLPPANGSETPNSSDCISRQAAIDIVEFECGEWSGLAKTIAEEIKQLPSAQPERTCVNCGRTANNGGWYADGGTRCPIEEHYALPKDGYCHLWEKRNVTDDDYTERREE